MVKKKALKAISKLPVVSKRVAKKKATQNDSEGTPRITSDTVAEHREEVLAGARRFIYPLQHSKHRVVIVSIVIVVGLLLGSIGFTGLLLYRYQSTSNFAYQVSQIVPFPVAKVDGRFISYEDYLFELRYSLFYFKNYDQEGVDIGSSEGQKLIGELKAQALEKVKLDALARQLASNQGITITEEEINRQIEVIRSQGGIGDSDEALEEILRSSYDWSIGDLRRTIRAQLTRQSLPSVLDRDTIEKAQAANKKLTDGAKFETIAKDYSDDVLTRENGGTIGLISRTNTDLPPEFIEAAFNLQPGETSELIESRFGLHIIRVKKVQGDQREVAHILFSYFDVDEFLRDELKKVESVDYIKVK